MIREQIYKITIDAVSKLSQNSDEIKISVRPTADKKFGDYFAIVNFHGSKDSPKGVARAVNERVIKEISENLKANIAPLKFFKKIETAGLYINFFLTDDYVVGKVREILEAGDNFGKLQTARHELKTALVEFISANPTGKLHLGHGRNAFYGDALANILSAAGWQVTREYYQNDAKASAQIKNLGKTALGKGEQYKSEYLDEVLNKVKNKLKGVSDDGQAGYIVAEIIFEDLKKFIEKDLKIKFDNIFYEQALYDKGDVLKMEKWLKEKSLIYQKDGAWWLKTSAYGDDEDRVAVRSDGAPTYLLPDVAYHKNKFDRNFGKLITILGADHQGHIKKLQAVQNMLGFEKNEMNLLFCQLVMLKDESGIKKMSKRAGSVVYLDWLVKEVGLDAARFFFLMRSLETHMDFDVGLAKEQSSKNPVFYVQYAHARISSLLKKAGDADFGSADFKLLRQPSEISLIKELMRLPEAVEDTAKDYQIQRLPNYTIKAATAFHKFYDECRILEEKDDLKNARLALAKAAQIVLKNSLRLLGVSAPERM